MADTKDASNAFVTFINNMFDSWSEKLWFKVTSVLMLFIIVIYILSTPFWFSYMNRRDTSEIVDQTMSQHEYDAREAHLKAYEFSQQTYAIAKQVMKKYLNTTNCDYIFLIEYHNGNENPVTGIQFCRFDITLEATSDNAVFVPLEKFKDDIVARYDLLLSSELRDNKVLVYNKEAFNSVDRYLAYQLSTVNAEAYAIVNLMLHGKVYASLLFVSTKPDISTLAVYDCAIDINRIFSSSAIDDK